MERKGKEENFSTFFRNYSIFGITYELNLRILGNKYISSTDTFTTVLIISGKKRILVYWVPGCDFKTVEY